VTAATPEGVLSADQVSLSAVASYNTKDAGTDKTITVVYSLSGADKDNYEVPKDYTTPGVITKRDLSIGGLNLVTTKVYDGTNTADVKGTQLQNVIASESPVLNVTGRYEDKNQGTDKKITVLYSLTGPDAVNYNAPPAFVTTNGVITPRDLSITAAASDKVFDNSTTAQVTLFSNQLLGDDIHITYASADFFDSNAGNHPVNVIGVSISGTDARNYNLLSESATTTARIVPAGTNTELSTSASTLRFMDSIMLTAKVTPQKGEGITGTIQFKIDGVNFGPAVPAVQVTGDPLHTVQATSTKQVDQMPGSHSVTADFISTTTNYNSSSSQSASLQIHAREASPYTTRGFYTGDIFAWTTSASSSKGTLTLAATIKDVSVVKGDVRAAKVTFYSVTGAVLTPIQGARDLPVGLINIDDPTLGAASNIVQFDIGSQNAAPYTIAVGISGAYTNNPSAACAQKLVTIAKPLAGGSIVGAGEVSNESSSGYIKGVPDKVTTFEFDMTYTKSGSNPKGKNSICVLSYCKPDGTLDSKIHCYWIQSTAISLLSIVQGGSTGATADFSSKANLYEQMPDLSLVLIEGGAALQMQAYQRCFDQQIAITLYRRAGGIWFSSNWVSVKTKLKSINVGGVVQVFGGDSACKSATNATRDLATAQERGAFSGQQGLAIAYPNPTESQFNIKLQSSNTVDAITILVYSVEGRLIQQKQNLHAGQTIVVGAQYRPGAYILEIIQGNQHRKMKLLKIPD
jgi:trimeric autotransporter adhesin